jgi:hypothetical protein
MPSDRMSCKGCTVEMGGRGKLPADGLCGDCRRRSLLRPLRLGEEVCRASLDLAKVWRTENAERQ